MTENYRDELDMLKYFWDEKGDISRYCNYDEAKLREYLPHVWQAWTQYRQAHRMLNAVLGLDPNEKIHYCDYANEEDSE
jgi:hypothetical protein